ncbi:hypothetical protein SLEP1_g31483 [Rubroshorea leprosula]|uniref:Uncharacterized protein n=1 Tax=Rubroshorea leprosula TaxID=152421 RepID=A0AAV5KAH8_9ROSI|nr:hypothetical protein SLEP1_g31483 [Rubroshorea leprosula]
MQIGGLTPAKSSSELDKVQVPSPHIKPEVTVGPKASALALFTLFHTNNISCQHTSMAKYGSNLKDFKLIYPSGTGTAHLVNSLHSPEGTKLPK